MEPNKDGIAFPGPEYGKPGKSPFVEAKPLQPREGREVLWRTLPRGDKEEPVAVPDYVMGEVILMGRPADLEALINRVRAAIERDGAPGLEGPEVLSSPERNGLGLETRRYTFAAKTEADADAMLARIREQVLAAPPLPVLASRNYVFSTPLEGSTYHGEGSPYHGEGSPYTPSAVAPADLYWQQWAFGADIGLDVDRGGPRDQRGKMSQVIVFDTSCFERPARYIFSGKGWIEPWLDLNVWHPLTLNLPAGPGRLVDESAHGLFVAGLAHGVAPVATLHLIRVLDDYGRGEMAGLIYVLDKLDRTQLDNSVLNLSLGYVRVDKHGNPTPVPDWRELCRRYRIPGCDDLESLLSHFDEIAALPKVDAQALWDALEFALLEVQIRELAAPTGRTVIAAASGNRSQRGHPLDAQIPANLAKSYEGLLAVAASDYTCGPAFYSQKGTVGAPGGGDPRPGCDRRDQMPGCWRCLEHWLISISRFTSKVDGSKYFSYGFWAGTSFSTPLVSGKAAVDYAARPDAVSVARNIYLEVQPGTPDPLVVLGKGIAHFPFP